MKKDIKSIKALAEKNASILLSNAELKLIKGGDGDNSEATEQGITTLDIIML